MLQCLGVGWPHILFFPVILYPHQLSKDGIWIAEENSNLQHWQSTSGDKFSSSQTDNFMVHLLLWDNLPNDKFMYVDWKRVFCKNAWSNRHLARDTSSTSNATQTPWWPAVSIFGKIDQVISTGSFCFPETCRDISQNVRRESLSLGKDTSPDISVDSLTGRLEVPSIACPQSSDTLHRMYCQLQTVCDNKATIINKQQQTPKPY